MFRIIIRQLQNSCYEMEQQIRILNSEIEELERVIAVISSLSGMGDVGTRLRNEKRAMQEEKDGFYQMLQALNKVLLNYIKCEERIIDECEQNTYSFRWKETGQIHISRRSHLIS